MDTHLAPNNPDVFLQPRNVPEILDPGLLDLNTDSYGSTANENFELTSTAPGSFSPVNQQTFTIPLIQERGPWNPFAAIQGQEPAFFPEPGTGAQHSPMVTRPFPIAGMHRDSGFYSSSQHEEPSRADATGVTPTDPSYFPSPTFHPASSIGTSQDFHANQAYGGHDFYAHSVNEDMTFETNPQFFQSTMQGHPVTQDQQSHTTNRGGKANASGKADTPSMAKYVPAQYSVKSI
jgi:hypothetical protein